MANRTTLVMLHLYKKSCQFAALFFVCVNCLGGNAGEYEWQLPPGFPQPRVPADNPMNLAKVELGRQLFFDTRLSIDNNYACATCHLPERFFTDGRAQAVGVHGDLHPRSSMSLFNVAYNPVFGWASMATDSLEKQVLIPLFNTQPPEMGLSQSNDAAIPNSNVISSEEVIQRLQKDRHYQNQFNKAFGQEATIDIANVAKAIAAYERTLISGNSAYDRFVFFDEQDALSKEQKAGMQLFFSARVGCSNCHGGFNFL